MVSGKWKAVSFISQTVRNCSELSTMESAQEDSKVLTGHSYAQAKEICQRLGPHARKEKKNKILKLGWWE